MNGNNVGLLDSNVIIDAAKGIVSIERIVDRYNFLYTSIINYVEVLGYNFADDNEKKSIIGILNNIPVINLDTEIADIAIQFRKRRKIKLPDALIAATAKKIDAEIITRNISDFQNLDTELIITEPELNTGRLYH